MAFSLPANTALKAPLISLYFHASPPLPKRSKSLFYSCTNYMILGYKREKKHFRFTFHLWICSHMPCGALLHNKHFTHKRQQQDKPALLPELSASVNGGPKGDGRSRAEIEYVPP